MLLECTEDITNSLNEDLKQHTVTVVRTWVRILAPNEHSEQQDQTVQGFIVYIIFVITLFLNYNI